MLRSLVGSEMCIRDRFTPVLQTKKQQSNQAATSTKPVPPSRPVYPRNLTGHRSLYYDPKSNLDTVSYKSCEFKPCTDSLSLTQVSSEIYFRSDASPVHVSSHTTISINKDDNSAVSSHNQHKVCSFTPLNSKSTFFLSVSRSVTKNSIFFFALLI